MEEGCAIAVFFHYTCPDGVFSALAVHMAMCGKSNLRFVPHTVYASDEELDTIRNSLKRTDTVYFLDYSGKRDFLCSCASLVSKVVLIDHHKTALEYMVCASC